MDSNLFEEFMKLARDHYWDSLEPQKDLILKHLESIASSAQRTVCRLGDNPIHAGPFLATPEGRSKCSACGEEWER